MGRTHEVLELTRIRVLSFVREPEAVFWVLVFPLVLAMILGWAFQDRGPSTERVGVYVGTSDPTITAAEILGQLEHAEGLQVELIQDLADAEKQLRFGRIACLILPESPPVLRCDPQRPEAELARLRCERALFVSNEERQRLKIESRTENGSRYIDWLFPGLLGMNLMGSGIWGIGFTIADIRQKKLLRRFLVTPMRKSSFLLSFVLSRAVFLVGEVSVLVAFAAFVLGVPLNGTLLGLAFLCALGTLMFAALGVLIASRAQTLEGVSGLMNLCMVPMWLFSGVFFSSERFPEAAQGAIRLLPLTAVNDALRSLMLEAAPLSSLGFEITVQAAWLVVCFAVGIWIFRWE